jgi:hypothetical protein
MLWKNSKPLENPAVFIRGKEKVPPGRKYRKPLSLVRRLETSPRSIKKTIINEITADESNFSNHFA